MKYYVGSGGGYIFENWQLSARGGGTDLDWQPYPRLAMYLTAS